MAQIDPHPARKAAAPQSPMVDGWMGDDWFHNGAFRNPSLDYALEMSLDKGAAGTTPPTGVGDQYTRYLHAGRSEEHTSELQSLMRISYAVFCLKKKTPTTNDHSN